MSETTEYAIGSEVSTEDGVCGELSRVVIDPVARSLTHLVVEPHSRLGLGRLVPIELVDPNADGIRLRCSAAQFEALQDAEATNFLSGAEEQLGYEPEQAFVLPYYGLRGADPGMAGVTLAGMPQHVSYDRVPVGEVDMRRGEHVHASDGVIGRIQGLVIDPGDHHVTHVLLEEGHVWGKKEVAIPISAITDVTAEGAQVSLSKDEIRELPAVDLAHHR
jgi:sporulation protein YlmC with PRC-barrel domain